MPDVWSEIEDAEYYAADSLETEGFIHCSFVGQLKGVVERYYAGAESVVILEIDPSKLENELRLEKATNDELFPHIYGNINMNSIVSVSVRKNTEIQDQGDGLLN